MLKNDGPKLSDDAHTSLNFALQAHILDRAVDLDNALELIKAYEYQLATVVRERDEMQNQLEAALQDAQLLHSSSAMLVDEENVDVLYQKLVDVATSIMRSDFGSMQRYDAERNALELIAHRGLGAEALAFWRWVKPGQATTCGQALHRSERVIVPDFETCDFIVGSADASAFSKAGVLAAQSTPLITRDGRLVGMLTTHWTRRYQPSERDLRLLDIVARQAADLIERNMATHALRRHAAQLVEADRYKNEFLATLAHELRNPLAPIRNGLTVLKMGKQEQTPRVLQMMERQIGHMVHLIDDLLDVSRISLGVITLKPSRVGLSTLVDSAVETSRPLIRAANHNFSVTLPGDVVWLEVDVMRVVQIISNLLNNAAKYTPPGGQIELVAEVVDTEVVIRIIDTGIGIAAAMLPKIFGLFTQVDGAAERSQGGLGVGLALSRKLAEMHDGCIEAESLGEDKGSVFTLRLPTAAPVAALTIPQDELAKLSEAARSFRILVVDDNADAAETLSMVLESLGHHTHVVVDSRLAVAAAHDFKPDVAFLDLGMPYLNGFDLGRQLRASPALDHVWLTALSGWGTDDDQEKSRAAGIDHHLTKPVMLEDVINVLSALTQRVEVTAAQPA